MWLVRDALPPGKVLALVSILVGFGYWGHYVFTAIKPVTNPVVETVESTIRPSLGPSVDNNNDKKQDLTSMVPDVSQEPNRVLLL